MRAAFCFVFYILAYRFCGLKYCLFHLNQERILQCILIILDADLPFGIASYIIFTPCCTEVVAVFLPILQATLQAEGMTGSTIVLLIEELIVGMVDAFRKENSHIYLRIVYLDIVRRVSIAYVILGEGLALGILLVDRETGSEIGRSGQAVVPYGHPVEVAALVERDDAVLHHVLHIAYGRWVVSQFNGEAERTVIQYPVILVAVRQNLVLAHHEAWCTQSQGSAHTIRIQSVAMVEMEGGEDIRLS